MVLGGRPLLFRLDNMFARRIVPVKIRCCTGVLGWCVERAHIRYLAAKLMDVWTAQILPRYHIRPGDPRTRCGNTSGESSAHEIKQSMLIENDLVLTDQLRKRIWHIGLFGLPCGACSELFIDISMH